MFLLPSNLNNSRPYPVSVISSPTGSHPRPCLPQPRTRSYIYPSLYPFCLSKATSHFHLQWWLHLQEWFYFQGWTHLQRYIMQHKLHQSQCYCLPQTFYLLLLLNQWPNELDISFPSCTTQLHFASKPLTSSITGPSLSLIQQLSKP